MTLIVLCANYEEYHKFIRATFPRLSSNQDRMLKKVDFTFVYDKDTVDHCLSLERNMPCITLPGFKKIPKNDQKMILDTLNKLKQVVHVNVTAKLDR